MGKRSAVVELFLGDMGSMQRELRPSIQREDQLTMETKLEQIAVKAVNQLPESVVREIRTPRSVGACSEASCHSSGWKSRRHRSPIDVVVISSDGKGDRSVESLDVKASCGWKRIPVRSVRGGEQPDRP
jgi:hypothetical protein